jgi:hypothetical protein
MKGFVSPMLMMGVGLVLMGIAVGIQTKRLESAKSELAIIKVLGEQAEKKAKERELADKQRKEKADADHKKAIAGYLSTIKRLRDANTHFLPPAPAGSNRPDQACYPRRGLDEALRTGFGEITGVLEELGTAAVDLNTAKEWATVPLR